MVRPRTYNERLLVPEANSHRSFAFCLSHFHLLSFVGIGDTLTPEKQFTSHFAFPQ